MENIPVPYMIIGGLIAFALFWSVIVWLIAQIAGWPKLVEKYPPRRPWNETCWRLQSAQIRTWANYNGILKVCADAEGIHISTILPFSMGNAPFSVPWSEINGRKRERFLLSIVELRFQRVPDIPMQISLVLADRLVQASGGAWLYEVD
ncbi:MAG: hypothetical protein GY805_34465 [Chloroflexi bacterium]|nr:hypothetical protein [Chloroflexota bacterium]